MKFSDLCNQSYVPPYSSRQKGRIQMDFPFCKPLGCAVHQLACPVQPQVINKPSFLFGPAQNESGVLSK